jgi:hypothetical protein
MINEWSHVEAGSNTSTVALRVVEGDEKGTRSWGRKWTNLSLGDIHRDLVLQVGGWT